MMKAMRTVTLTKTEYKELKTIKKRYEAIRQMIRTDLFETPPTKKAKPILAAFRKTGLYNDEFLKSLGKGFKESSYFSRK